MAVSSSPLSYLPSSSRTRARCLERLAQILLFACSALLKLLDGECRQLRGPRFELRQQLLNVPSCRIEELTLDCFTRHHAGRVPERALEKVECPCLRVPRVGG